MLLLVTLALVVASAVLLILGFVQDALGFIYLSMLCAGVAALALFVFARLARRRSAVLAGAGAIEEAAPARRGRAAAREERVSEREAVGAVTVRAASESQTRSLESRGSQPEVVEEEGGIDGAGELADEGAWRPEPDTATQPAVTAAVPVARAEEPAQAEEEWPEDEWADWGDEVVFPIEDYDELRVSEILPLLSQLEPDELQEVRDRELAGKARATILDRIDDRLGRPSKAARPAVAAEPVAPEPVVTEPVTPAPARKAAAPARKASARKAPAKKAAPAPRAAKKAAEAPAKKTTARKAPAPRNP